MPPLYCVNLGHLPNALTEIFEALCRDPNRTVFEVVKPQGFFLGFRVEIYYCLVVFVTMTNKVL